MRLPCKPHLLRAEDLMYLVVWGGKRAAIVVWKKKAYMHQIQIKKINLCFFHWFFLIFFSFYICFHFVFILFSFCFHFVFILFSFCFSFQFHIMTEGSWASWVIVHIVYRLVPFLHACFWMLASISDGLHRFKYHFAFLPAFTIMFAPISWARSMTCSSVKFLSIPDFPTHPTRFNGSKFEWW